MARTSNEETTADRTMSEAPTSSMRTVKHLCRRSYILDRRQAMAGFEIPVAIAQSASA
jgi:hypothetical protein